MNKNVTEFVGSTSKNHIGRLLWLNKNEYFFLDNDNKNSGLDSSTHESNRSHQVNVKRNRKTKKKTTIFLRLIFDRTPNNRFFSIVMTIPILIQ